MRLIVRCQTQQRRRAVKLNAMSRFSARALSPLCLMALTLASGCAPAQVETAQIETVAARKIAPPAVTAPVERALLADKAIDELSGLTASRRYPGLLWCHNDSGDTARIFAINAKGETVATVDFAGLEARDWEDITFAGGWIYVGEIGDNFAVNPDIRVYRTREPRLNPRKIGQTVTLQPRQWQQMTLHYPDGARDAETLAATPDGRLLIVSKNKAGSNFYALRRPFADGLTTTLDKIESGVQFGATGWLTKLVTGGELSPDGRELALTTYSQLVQIPLARPFDFKSLQLNQRRTRALPALKQCESLCYSAKGRSLWISSEGVGAPLWELPLASGGH